jgi:hypothetical protein
MEMAPAPHTRIGPRSGSPSRPSTLVRLSRLTEARRLGGAGFVAAVRDSSPQRPPVDSALAHALVEALALGDSEAALHIFLNIMPPSMRTPALHYHVAELLARSNAGFRTLERWLAKPDLQANVRRALMDGRDRHISTPEYVRQRACALPACLGASNQCSCLVQRDRGCVHC